MTRCCLRASRQASPREGEASGQASIRPPDLAATAITENAPWQSGGPGVVLAGLAIFGLARAAESLDVTLLSSERYFSPNGDGQEDVASMSYCLSRSANVDIWVADGSGDRVRTIESGVSHSGVLRRATAARGVGRQGRRRPGGARWRVHRPSAGAHLRRRERRGHPAARGRHAGPGRAHQPGPRGGALGHGGLGVHPDQRVRPGQGVGQLPGRGRCVASDSPGPDGRFSGTLEVSGCTNGDNQLHSAVAWTDPFGRSHSWSAPAVAVTSANSAAADGAVLGALLQPGR